MLYPDKISTLALHAPPLLSSSALIVSCTSSYKYMCSLFFFFSNNGSKSSSLARIGGISKLKCCCPRVDLYVYLCMQGVGAREVSSTVALHLTSILITSFQQRSSSLPLPQSNGLTREASLNCRATLGLPLLWRNTHTLKCRVSSHRFQEESGGSRSVLPQ